MTVVHCKQCHVLALPLLLLLLLLLCLQAHIEELLDVGRHLCTGSRALRIR
jgi:hypothetical protein